MHELKLRFSVLFSSTNKYEYLKSSIFETFYVLLLSKNLNIPKCPSTVMYSVNIVTYTFTFVGCCVEAILFILTIFQ